MVVGVVLLINWNASRMRIHTGFGGARTQDNLSSKGYVQFTSGGSITTATAQQGASQCVSAYKTDTHTAQCQTFCNSKFRRFHCLWCKCRACDFCPKGGEAIEEATKAGPPPSPPPSSPVVSLQAPVELISTKPVSTSSVLGDINDDFSTSTAVVDAEPARGEDANVTNILGMPSATATTAANHVAAAGNIAAAGNVAAANSDASAHAFAAPYVDAAANASVAAANAAVATANVGVAASRNDSAANGDATPIASLPTGNKSNTVNAKTTEAIQSTLQLKANQSTSEGLAAATQPSAQGSFNVSSTVPVLSDFIATVGAPPEGSNRSSVEDEHAASEYVESAADIEGAEDLAAASPEAEQDRDVQEQSVDDKRDLLDIDGDDADAP